MTSSAHDERSNLGGQRIMTMTPAERQAKRKVEQAKLGRKPRPLFTTEAEFEYLKRMLIDYRTNTV